MEHKQATVKGIIETKEDGDLGTVRAVFSTLDVIDLDDDVTLPGAFGSQNVRIAAWGHDWRSLPVGRGAIGEESIDGRGVAVLNGQFNLKTTAGRDHFLTIKDQAELQEWSYGFDVLKSSFGERDGRRVRFLESLKVHEVSPVMLGAAGPGRTATLAAKGLDFAQHADRVEDYLDGVKAFIEHASNRADMRAKEGRVLSTANVDRLKGLLSRMREIADELDGLVTSATPAPQDDGKSIAELRAIFERTRFEHARALRGI